jgi:cyanate permease
VALAGFGWRGALLMLMVFPLLALLSWLPQSGASGGAADRLRRHA